MRTINVVPNHLATNGLATNIPELYCDIDIACQPQLLKKKVHTYCLLVTARKLKGKWKIGKGDRDILALRSSIVIDTNEL